MTRRAAVPVLLLACLAQFMVVLDVSVVNVALPAIRGDLGFSQAGLQWVVNAYTLTFAGFLLLSGRAADLFGHRRVFLGGVALFTVASLVGGFSSGQTTLVAARAVQGLGAAVISPASLAIIMSHYAPGNARNRALGAWGAMGGAGGAVGVLAGGILTNGLSWRWTLFVNVPVGLFLLGFGPLSLRAATPPERRPRLDVAGALTVTAGLTAVVYGIVRTETLGWTAPTVLGSLAAGVALLAAFVFVEGRVAAEPLMPLRLFTARAVVGANLVILLLGSALFAMWFFLSLYLQQVLGYSALRAGFAFLPMTLSIVAASSLASRVVARLGARATLVTGMLCGAAGLALFARLPAAGRYAFDVLPGGVLVSIGLGLALVPVTIAAVSGLPARDSGLASGVLNTSRLIGGSLGLAVLATVATSRTRAATPAGAGREAIRAALTTGYTTAFLLGAGLCALGALAAAALLPRRTPRPVPHPAPAASPTGTPAVDAAGG